MKKAAIVLFIVMMSLAASAQAATISVFTDRSAWETAVHGTFVEETFTAPPLLPGLSYSRGFVYYPGGYYMDDMVLGDPSGLWQYGSGFYAFGASWDINYDGKGTGLLLAALYDGGSQAILPEVPGGFFGIISTDQLLTGIQVNLGPHGGLGERYLVDNIVISDTPPGGNVVPEPSSVLLWSLGMGAMAFFVRKRLRM